MELAEFLFNLDRAVTFLVAHVRDPNDSYRQARDKVRKRVLFAAARGELRADNMVGGTQDQPLPTGQFIAWARTKWPSKLEAFSAEYRVATGSNVGLSCAIYLICYPPDVASSHQALREAEGKIRDLTKQLKEARGEIVRLRPIEAQFDAWCKQNQQNAKQARKQ